MEKIGTRIFIVLFALSIILGAGTVQTISASTPTLYVKAHHGNDANDCLSPSTACKTIQAAINKAASGDTIRILPGTYVENLIVNKQLVLAGSEDTVILPATANPDCRGGGSGSLCTGYLTAPPSVIILVQADNVVIHDLTLDGHNPSLPSGVSSGGVDVDARDGIIEDFHLGTFNNLEIYDTTVRNIYLRGIEMVGSGYGETFNIHDNVVRNVQGDPNLSVAIFNFGGSGTFANNFVSDSSDAINSNWSFGTKYLKNTVTHSGSGIHTDNVGGAGTVGPDIIQDNKVKDSMSGGYGIFVFAPYLPVTVQDNEMTNVDIGLAAYGQQAPVTTTFSRNRLQGNNKPSTVGILVSTSLLGFGSANVAISLQDNRISDFSEGIHFEAEAGYTLTASATGNKIEDNGIGANVLGSPFTGTVSITANHNEIEHNKVGFQNAATNSVDATLNWWGNPTGPFNASTNPSGKGNSVSNNVNFQPWLCNENGSCTRS
jgi:nitrous oxidase accessory protein NosD